MIVGTELRRWLADKEEQRRTRCEADACAAAWNDGVHHQAFAAAMAALPDRDAGSVAAAVAALLEDDRWASDLVDSLVSAMRRNRWFEPPFRHMNGGIHRGLVVYEDDLVSLAVATTDVQRLMAKKARAAGRSVLFSGQVELFRFLKAGGAKLSFWSAPPITAHFSAANAGRCRRTGERPITDGETLRVDGRCESFVIERAQASLFILQASVKPDRAPVAVEYDAASLEYVGCSAADDSASRIQMITSLLRKLSCAAAFSTISEFLDHPSFFVRWHVMRELIGLDARAALPHLKRMAARDPHPETRKAARTVLDRLEAPPADRKAA